MRRRIGAALATGIAAALLLAPGTAIADNEYLDSDPRPGATLDLEPSRVTIAFDDDVPPESTTIVVRDPSGKVITDRDHHVEGNNIYSNLPYPLPAGVYRVDYRALDGDVPFGGSFEFAWRTDAQAVGLSQWRSASKIPDVLALPGDDELRRAAENASPSPTPTASESATEAAAPSDGSAGEAADTSDGFPWWGWFILPLVAAAGAAWWFAARRRSA